MPFATIIDYLDEHAGAFTALLTLALVAVTIYYAIQNYRMVGEMAKARRATIRPTLAIEFHRIGPTAITVAVRNVGPGAALDIDVRMIYVPARDSGELVERRWRRKVLMSGEQYDFFPPGALDGNLNALPATYPGSTDRGGWVA